MLFILTFLVAVLVFSAVIAIHELGHFTVAKLCGIQVNEFSIGMGPALWKKIYKGTQYSIRALPVGGFVALEGEESPESQQAEARKKAEDGQQGSADPEEAPDADADTDATAEPEPHDEDENPVPPEQRTGIPLNAAPAWQRILVMAAGAFMNFVLGFAVLLVLVATQNGAITSRVIAEISDGALCGQTGLQVDDEVVAVNGRRCFIANDMIYELVRTQSYQADFTVKRDGQTVELKGVQFDTETDENGQTQMVLGFKVYGIKKTPLNVAKEAWNMLLYYGRLIFSSLVDLFMGRESINDLSGPVGIVSAIGQAVSYGWRDVLSLLALITINLGIFNLLPFPALDGGKVVFLLIECVTGRAVPEKIQGGLTFVAFVLLFALMIFATYNDILRLFTGGF